MNFVTVFVTALLACFEILVIIFQCIGCIFNDRWDQWVYCLYVLIGLAAIWIVCFLIALIVCRKRLVIMENVLFVAKGQSILYSCPLSEVIMLDHEPFAPITRSSIGELIIINKKHPLPNNLYLYMSRLSYWRVVRFFKKKKSSL